MSSGFNEPAGLLLLLLLMRVPLSHEKDFLRSLVNLNQNSLSRQLASNRKTQLVALVASQEEHRCAAFTHNHKPTQTRLPHVAGCVVYAFGGEKHFGQ